MNACRAWLSDGLSDRPSSGRWHFQHGPIDIVVGAVGDASAVAAAHEAAWARFGSVLAELVAELPLLRQPVAGPCALQGVVARRMWAACRPHRARFITPMAAVAGSVADELIHFYRRPGVHKAWVNNGGDVALHLAPGHSIAVGLFADLARLFSPPARSAAAGTGLPLDGTFDLGAEQPVRGLATSGWRGRSFSFGIADSVTVLAATAAVADAAATMLANAVNIEHPLIRRRPANELRDDTDLGERCVTVDVPALPQALVQQALAAGRAQADALRGTGLIDTAVLVCQGQVVICAADTLAHAA